MSAGTFEKCTGLPLEKKKKTPPPAKKRTMANGLVTLSSLLVSAFLMGGVTN